MKKSAPGKLAKIPATISPMLATLVNKPVDDEGWVFEVKWDGYRAIAIKNGRKTDLISRNNKSFNDKFYPVYEAVKEWDIRGVVDGEIVVLNDAGRSDFASLQNWRSEADGTLIFYVFDLLWLDGRDLTAEPLHVRRELLRQQLPPDGIIRMSESFDTPVKQLLEAGRKIGLEGIIAKKADSKYHPGDRTREWLKIKLAKRHEVVIGGFTKNEGSAKAFSSLLVGVYEGDEFVYAGKVGTGFSDKLQKEMMVKFRPLITKKMPFSFLPDVNKPSRFRPNPPKAEATWLKPQLICEVNYAEITSDGVMRHPSFEAMREDKKAKDVVREKATPVIKSTLLKAPGEQGRKTLLNPAEVTQVRKVKGHELKFTNLSKIFWPKEKYTKRDMLNYYYQVAPCILPYLKNRPQSMNRFPNGIDGKSFYQKDITGKAPEWIQQYPYHTSDGEDKNFLVVDDEASLLYMANLGTIEMNPWNSRIQKPDHPDWCMIDLDPSEKNTFNQVIEAAMVTKQVLDKIGVTGYPKTSGSTGIHIYIPLQAKYTYDEAQLFAKWIAAQVHHELPRYTSIERMTRNRRGKLYVDYLQNRPKATLAAPYSLRPKPGATVSMPLHWEEVKKGLQMKDFTINNALERIKSEGDIFKPVLGRGIHLKKILKEFEAGLL